MTAQPVTGVAPDDAKHAIAAGVANMHIVTAYALAVQHTQISPATDPAPDWFATLSKSLDTAKTHAQNWIDLVPTLTATIPSSVINFGSEFTAASNLILGLLQQAEGLSPTSDEYKTLVTKAVDYLTALRQELITIDGTIESAGKQLDATQAAAEADFMALTNGVDSIQTAVAELSRDIANANADIKEMTALIDSENRLLTDAVIGVAGGLLILVAGIALAAVTFGLGATVAIGGGLVTLAGAGTAIAMRVLISAHQDKIAKDQSDKSAEKQQIIMLGALKVSIQSLRDQNSEAQQALTSIRAMWVTFDKTLEKTISLIGKAEDPLNTVLDELWVRDAQHEWGALVDFAVALEGMTVQQQDQGLLPLGASH